jgi:polysaccharide biosynthesis transport protein
MNDQASAPQENRNTGGQLIAAAQTVPATFEPYGPPGYRGSTVVEEPELFGVKVFEYLRILNKRKWLILGITAAVVAVSAVRTLMQTPLYTATVRLQIDRNAVAQMVGGGNTNSIQTYDDLDYEFMQTQYQVLQSRTMAERVASALKSRNDPGISVGAVLGGRVVRSITGTRLFDISYSDPEPERAQLIANAYADAVMDSNIDKRFQANASAKTFLEDKIKQLKLRLEESEKKMLAFAQQQQIVDVNDKTSIAETNLAAANAALGTLISERAKNEQLWQQVENADAINLPQLLSNEVIAKLRNQRKELVIEYQEKLETFKPSYPGMVQITNKIKEIDQQIAAETQAIKASLKAAYESSLAQENDTKARIETLRQDVLDLQKRSIQYNILKREVDTNRELYTSLLQRYKEVDVASGVGANNVFVVDRAQLPGGPSSPNLLRALRLAFFLGLGSALGLAYVLEFLDDKVRSPEQVEQVSGLSLLGVIPKVANVDEELTDPRSGLAEAYRSLCTALQFTTDQGLPRTMLITSAGPAEGKSLTSMAIARHFANIGRKVLLVDGDLRNPSLHVRLDCENTVGLSNYLTGACAPPQTMQATEAPNLAFISSGPLPPNAADLLGSARMHSLLSVGLEVFDLIVVDGPPVMGLADAQLLSSAAAATVFIVGAGQARTGSVRGALRRLQLSRGTIVGAVLTKYDAKAAGYGYGYGHGHGYGYGYGYGGSAPRLTVDPSRQGAAQAQIGDAHGGA